jgi:hypothetical protein
MHILGEQREPLGQERNELVRHLLQLGDEGVGRDVAVARADGVVDKQQVRKLVPRAVDHLQLAALADAVRANLHQRAVLTAAARPAVEPYDGTRLVRDVAVLKVPEEEVAVLIGRDFDVAAPVRNVRTCQGPTHPACIFTSGTPSGEPGRLCTK